MGNTSAKPFPKPRNKKYLHLKGADRPSPPGKPYLVAEQDVTPDVLTIRWNPPLRNGGIPLTGYLVEHRRTGSPHWVRATPLMVQPPELTLSGLEPGWRYQFRVFAENLAGLSDPSELSEPLTVTLQRSAITATKFTQELKDTIALENEKVEFVVHFSGQPNPKISWYKDGFEMFSSRRTRITTESDRSILTIHQCAICDEGEIKCTATNKAGHVTTKARLTLEAPPSIRLPRNYEDGLLFEIGELVRLKISVAGLPRPLIFWSHNGESVNENERYEIENDDVSSTLRISEASRNDRGEYQIKAVNKLGSDISSFLVTITDKPSPPGKARVIMTLGKSVTLSWNSPEDDGGCKVGNYIVEYFRLGWNVWLKAATSRQLTTILGDLIEGSEYKFRVKAESPFGVSEPSEESDLVFIPDHKRGILTPAKGEVENFFDSGLPLITKRKKIQINEVPSKTPIRPDRNRIKSPPKTPDNISPQPDRKEININKIIFDRESMARELSYGSPEIKIKKTDVPQPKVVMENQISNSVLHNSIKNNIRLERRKSPSPVRSPSPNVFKERSPESMRTRSKLSRENSENMGGSSEYMMVLYTDVENASDFGIDMNNQVIPPLSLSAPELSALPESPLERMKWSASSSELLHERAMVRFYQEALAEEEAINKRKLKVDENSALPKIQINSIDAKDVVGLERKHSLRRRLSAGGSVPQQVLWAQQRQNLRRYTEYSDLHDNKLKTLSAEEKRELMQNRQRSESEEREEEEFNKVRLRVGKSTEENRKHRINVLNEDFWNFEELSSDSGDERHESIKIKETSSEEENETYHPRMVENIAKYVEPFEILTKPAKLPDANFIPKPILKKKDTESRNVNEINENLYKHVDREDAFSSRYDNNQEEVEQRKRCLSPMPSGLITKRGSLPDVQLLPTLEETRLDTSAVASVAGVTAAGIIISQPILQKREAEEAKVVIAHYGDIVKSCTNRNPRQNENNPIREALRKQAAMQAALQRCEEPEVEESEPELEIKPIPKYDLQKKPERKAVLSELKLNKNDPKFPVISQVTEVPSVVQSTIKIQSLGQSQSSNDSYEREDGIFQRTDSGSRITRIIKQENVDLTFNKPTKVDEIRRGRDESRYFQEKVLEEKRAARKSSPSPLRSDMSRTSSKSRTLSQKPNSRSNSSSHTSSHPPSQSSPRPPSRSSSKQRPLPLLNKRSPSPHHRYSSSEDGGFLRKPKMCEIMTQTSTSVDPYAGVIASRIDEELKVVAERTVKKTFDYVTDLALFAVACWLFLFDNELLALPFLLIAVFRQLQVEIKKLIPNWVKRRLNKNKKNK